MGAKKGRGKKGQKGGKRKAVRGSAKRGEFEAPAHADTWYNVSCMC
jgi:hypothetical protein